MTRTNALLVSILLASCSTEIGPGAGGPADPTEPDDHRDDGRDPTPQASPEQCNHYDDDLDGLVDDGCPCVEGQNQWCWASTPGQEQEGTCAPGLQWCDTSDVEFPEWGPCEGAALPAEDVCDDGEDQDCDGVDPACRLPDGDDDDPDVGDPEDPPPGDADDADDVDDPADPADDADQDPDQGPGDDQADNPEEVVEVDLFILGDCVTARCPAEAPYPVGCNVFFTPGDDRGCVASQTDDPTVYFQAGDECDAGLVTGTLLCSAVEGDPLDDQSCPINKPIPIYAADRDGCPDTH